MTTFRIWVVDKVLPIIASIILTASIGFIAAIFKKNDKINQLDRKIERLEKNIERINTDFYKPIR